MLLRVSSTVWGAAFRFFSDMDAIGAGVNWIKESGTKRGLEHFVPLSFDYPKVHQTLTHS